MKYAELLEADPRADKVLTAYGAMSPENKRDFRHVIGREDYIGHAQLASALQIMGFPIDRKQIHQFREKLRLGRVTLEPERTA